MHVEIVKDDEYLYRRVSAPSIHDRYSICNGNYVIEPAAFQDKNCQPSVYRAKLLKNSDPTLVQNCSTDGIVSIKVEDVRKIGPITTRIPGDPVKKRNVVVIHRPSNKSHHTHRNIAHAIITVDPEFSGEPREKRRAFREVQIALARLANENGAFILEPTP